MSLKKNDLTFLSQKEYFADITKQINLSKKSDFVALATMNLNTDAHCADLLKSLNKASKNGSEAYLFYDSYNYLTNRYSLPGPYFWNTKIPKNTRLNPWKNLQKNINELINNGAKVTLTNPPKKRFSLPFAGRSHIKFCVINDTVYLGGCNISRSNDIDIMVKILDKKLALEIKNLIKNVNSDNTVSSAMKYNDLIKEIGPRLDLIIDAGVKNQSKIYDEALDVINSAKDYIYMTCQFFPNSDTIKCLRDAHIRGVKIKLVYNHPSKHPLPKNLLHYAVKLYYKTKLPNDFFVNELPKNNMYIHSKILLNEETALIGSHNFVKAGVEFGTAEICLKIRSSQFNTEIINCINQQFYDKPRNLRPKSVF